LEPVEIQVPCNLLLAFRHKSTEHSTGSRSSVEEEKRERERGERERERERRRRRRRRRRRVLVPVHRDDEPSY
jgi:hypothetical protein